MISKIESCAKFCFFCHLPFAPKKKMGSIYYSNLRSGLKVCCRISPLGCRKPQNPNQHHWEKMSHEKKKTASLSDKTGCLRTGSLRHGSWIIPTSVARISSPIWHKQPGFSFIAQMGCSPIFKAHDFAKSQDGFRRIIEVFTSPSSTPSLESILRSGLPHIQRATKLWIHCVFVGPRILLGWAVGWLLNQW